MTSIAIVANPYNPNLSLTSIILSESMEETTFCIVRRESKKHSNF